MRRAGSARPDAMRAARTRSFASLTALSGRPTMLNAGRPGATCTCTSTARASMPSNATVVTRWTMGAPARGQPSGSHLSRQEQLENALRRQVAAPSNTAGAFDSRDSITRRGSAPEEPIALGLDGEPRAHEVASGTEREVAHVQRETARIDAERRLLTDLEVLIFDAEQHVDERTLVDHVVEAAAHVPAVVIARGAVAAGAGSVAETGDGRAVRVLEVRRRPAAGREDHRPVPGVADPRAEREQVGDLVLAEHVGLEAQVNRQHHRWCCGIPGSTRSAPLPRRAPRRPTATA